MQQKQIVIGSLFGILAALCFSMMATVVKLSDGVGIETLVFFRNIISIVILFPFMVQRKISLKTKHLKTHMIRSIAGVLGLYAYFYALRKLPLMNAILLSNTSPLFIPLIIFVWLRKKITKKRLSFLALGFLGIAFVLQPTLDFPFIPSIVGLFSGLLIAVGMTSVRVLSKTEPIESILFYFFALSVFVSFFPMILSWRPFNEIMWLYILGVGVLATLFQYFISKTYFYIPATQAGCFIYVSVFFGGVFEFIFFDKIPSSSVVLGSILIVTGGGLTLMDNRRQS